MFAIMMEHLRIKNLFMLRRWSYATKKKFKKKKI